MDYFYYILLGIIEGLTEFLPISSTAHLILFSQAFNISQNDFHKFFEIFIQSGAILAVVVTYFKVLKNNKELLKKIFISLLPTAILGILLYKVMKNIFFESNKIILFSLFFVSFLFFLIEFLIKKGKLKANLELKNLSYWQAFLVGVFQAIAIVPGVSRAGAVIVAMLFLNFKRSESVLYSFFLAVPTIILAGIYDFYKVGFSTISFSSQNLIYLVIGFLVAFFSAFLAIKWFLKYVQNHTLNIFAYYRIIIAILFLILLK